MVWLCKDKIWRKCKIMLPGYRWLYSINKKGNVYANVTKDVDARFDTWNYELDRPLPKG